MARKAAVREEGHATSGKDWRAPREKGVLVELPSGNIARIRDVGLDLLLKLGRIPDSLTPLVATRLGVMSEQKPAESDPLQQAQDILALAEAVCEVAFVEPRIVQNPQADDEISIDDLSFADKMFVLAVLERPARELANFRSEPSRAVESLASEPGDTPIT